MRAHVLLCRAPTLVIALIVVLAVSACSASPRAVQPSPTSAADTQAPTPLPTQPVNRPPSPVAGLLGPAPSSCPVVSPPSTYHEADFGGGFTGSVTFQGSAPAWEMGLGSPLNLEQYSGAVPYPSTKVMWVVGPNYAQPVTLTGHELQTGAALWFQVYPSNGVPTSNPDALSVYTTRAVLDPAAPNRGSTDNSTGHWNIWGIGVIVLAAGCYEVDVASAGGGWKMVFAAGR